MLLLFVKKAAQEIHAPFFGLSCIYLHRYTNRFWLASCIYDEKTNNFGVAILNCSHPRYYVLVRLWLLQPTLKRCTENYEQISLKIITFLGIFSSTVFAFLILKRNFFYARFRHHRDSHFVCFDTVPRLMIKKRMKYIKLEYQRWCLLAAFKYEFYMLKMKMIDQRVYIKYINVHAAERPNFFMRVNIKWKIHRIFVLSSYSLLRFYSPCRKDEMMATLTQSKIR